MLDFSEQEFVFDREIERTNFDKVWNRVSAKSTEILVEKEDLINIRNFDSDGIFQCYVGRISMDSVFNYVVPLKESHDLIILIREFVYMTHEQIIEDGHKGLDSIVIEMPHLLIDCIDTKYSKEEFESIKKSFLGFLDWLSKFEKKNKCNISFKQSIHSFIELKWYDDCISHHDFLANNTEQLIARSSKYDLVETIGYTEIKAFRKMIEYSFNKVEKYGIRI